jgi:hypothetical protein
MKMKIEKCVLLRVHDTTEEIAAVALEMTHEQFGRLAGFAVAAIEMHERLGQDFRSITCDFDALWFRGSRWSSTALKRLDDDEIVFVGDIEDGDLEEPIEMVDAVVEVSVPDEGDDAEACTMVVTAVRDVECVDSEPFTLAELRKLLG